MNCIEYLKSIGVKLPKHKNTIIIIDGLQGPTGKSTLQRVLKKMGYTHVFEQWEIDVTAKKIVLDKIIEDRIPNFDASISFE